MIVDLHTWNAFIRSHPEAHLLQSGAWGELKSGFGWKAVRILAGDCGAQILFKRLPAGFTIAYIPKGPLGDDETLLFEIDTVCRAHKTLFLKIEPNRWQTDTRFAFENTPGWVLAKPIQPRRTVILSLDGSLDDILSGMKQKTRYNIRLAEKKDVIVHPASDVTAFHRMSEITARRDGFGVHSQEYYQRALSLFKQDGQAEMLIASCHDQPLAGLMVFSMGETAYYMYGASTDEERNRMPTYLIQWHAIQWAKARGCRFYDLWGIPDVEETQLEEEFIRRDSHEGLWGVYRFKRGFGGQVFRSQGAWDRVYSPWAYRAYRIVMNLRTGGADL